MDVAVAGADLPIVDAFSLPAPHREALKPAERVRADGGRVYERPRYFYEVESWAVALGTSLTAHFGLWEFMDVDVREAALMRTYPRYIPCAVAALATALEVLRLNVGVPVRIAANGGYRSPIHGGNRAASPHSWAAAANIHRIGAESLDTEERIERYGTLARRLLPSVWVRPYGTDAGTANDHLHLDLGYVTVVPNTTSNRHHDAFVDGDARQTDT
jgi:hypothetical protein